MRTYLMAHGFDIWSTFKIGYTVPTNPPVDVVGKRLSENNAKAMNAILSSVEDS
jgi:hypothetical protein